MNAPDESPVDIPFTALKSDGPAFKEPWEASAFALALALHRGGYFTWQEWSAALAREIGRARSNERPDRGDTYYQHWLAALERLITEKGLTTEEGLLQRRKAWRDAYLNTPHGQPVSLQTKGRAVD